jgi:hypothetical protein
VNGLSGLWSLRKNWQRSRQKLAAMAATALSFEYFGKINDCKALAILVTHEHERLARRLTKHS